MSILSDLDAIIRDREAQFRHRLRLEEQAHEREIACLMTIRAQLAQEDIQVQVEAKLWLTRKEIAALPPRRTPNAVRRAILRAKKIDPVETRMRGKQVSFPKSWLERNSICAPCAPGKDTCAALQAEDPG